MKKYTFYTIIYTKKGEAARLLCRTDCRTIAMFTLFDSQLKEVLRNTKSIAIVGAKDKEGQPVDRVGRYMLSRGFTVYPIHPVRKNVWGLETFKSIPELAEYLKIHSPQESSPDIICLFRASEYCYEHAIETKESGMKPKIFWLQEGIKNEDAAKCVQELGIRYVEDLCVKIEYERFFPKNFECDLCGVCCEGKNGIVVDNHTDLPRLLNYFHCTEEELDAQYTHIHNNKRVINSGNDGNCLFYDKEKACTIHTARPDICRAWPYFRGNIIDNLSYDMAKSDCKGLRHGKDLTHEDFKKEAAHYLLSEKLTKNKSDSSSANALKYSDDEINLMKEWK